MEIHNIAWVSGLYEGEGTCVFIKSGRSVRVEFKISQKDRQILDWAQEVLGAGTVNGPYANGKNSIYSLYIQVYDDVRRAIRLMWPYLSDRRREQAMNAFDRYYDYKQSIVEKNKTCRKGVHPKSSPGACRECKLAYHRVYNKKQLEGVL